MPTVKIMYPIKCVECNATVFFYNKTPMLGDDILPEDIVLPDGSRLEPDAKEIDCKNCRPEVNGNEK